MVVEDFFVYSFWVFFVYLSVFGYSFFYTFPCVVCGNCAGLFICCFNDCCYCYEPFLLKAVLVGEGWYDGMFMVLKCFNYGVCLPVYSVFCKEDCFPNEMICGYVFFPLFLYFSR